MEDEVAPVTRNVNRGSDGLMDVQRRYFELLAQLGKRESVCASLGITTKQIGRWLREDPAFLRAHDGFFSASREATKARID